ncbi:MAG: ammonium transporter [Phycisphaerales bacterium]
MTPDDVAYLVHNLWILVAAALVFVMHLGFATLEAGLTRAKNTVNILFKNVGIVAIGLLTYAVVGFNLMYPTDAHPWIVDGVLGSFAPAGPAEGGQSIAYNGKYTYWTDFIFQGLFAATAATIVSGAVAERVKIGPFLVFSAIYVAIVYPIVGSWKWGTGWLDSFRGVGFYDFAGSTLVHSVGGWGALAGVIVLGPRLGKYVKTNGSTLIRPIMGHSMPHATIGMFLLWFGWYGFNGGSVLSADPASVSLVFVTTSLAAAAGIAGAMATSWLVQKQPDLTMVLNGALAGLVGITAGADVIPVWSAVLVGLVAGVLVVLAVVTIDRAGLDDPVGAISVHLVCGVWGTLAVGIFAPGKDFVAQLVGVGSIGATCFASALAIFVVLRMTVGVRVSREDELAGLDRSEHGMEAYAGFQFFRTQ